MRRLKQPRRLRILIGHETSGQSRRAFAAKGHDVWSCDLLPAVDGSPNHIIGDVEAVLDRGWDLAIFHPSCTYLTSAAAWAFGDGPYHQKLKPGTLVGAARREAREQAVAHVGRLFAARIPKVVIENPIGALSTLFRKPDQIVHPWMFGDDASKATCLWLRGVGPLRIDPAQRRNGRMVEIPGRGLVERWGNQTDSGQNRLTPTDDRWARRSETYPGLAQAFADNWG